MRLCLNMIVKNESAVIERCLRSVLPHVHCWAIADTGSSDGTQAIVRDLLAPLPGTLIERPWVDFASNRNEALALARDHGDYALMIDADDVLEVQPGRRFHALDGPGYALRIVDKASQYWRTALVRLDRDWHWRGVLHEFLTGPHLDQVKMLGGAQIRRIGGGARSAVDTVTKYRRDADILQRALADEPDNARYAFYLAQSLQDAGETSAALDAFRRRVAMGGWAEEVYLSKLAIARLSQQLGHAPEVVTAAYRDAGQFRPTRAEWACFLAQHFRALGRYEDARDCAQLACTMPIPSDSLMVNHHTHGWLSRYELAAALYLLGEYAACISVCEAMLADPLLPATERPRVRQNIDAARSASMAARN